MIFQEEAKVEETLAKGLELCVNEVKELVPWVHDPVDHTCFYLANMIPKKTLCLQSDIYHNMSVDDRLKFHERQPYPHMGKILDLMEKLVSVTFVPPACCPQGGPKHCLLSVLISVC